MDVWDEIIYPFPNFNSATLEVWEWVEQFIPQFTEHVIIYPCWDLSLTMLVKGATDESFNLLVPLWMIWIKFNPSMDK